MKTRHLSRCSSCRNGGTSTSTSTSVRIGLDILKNPLTHVVRRKADRIVSRLVEINRLGKRLGVRQQALATAQTYLKRFYCKVEIRRTNPYLVLTTAVYLACKMEECPHHIRMVVQEARSLWPGTHHALLQPLSPRGGPPLVASCNYRAGTNWNCLYRDARSTR